MHTGFAGDPKPSSPHSLAAAALSVCALRPAALGCKDGPTSAVIRELDKCKRELER